MEIAYLTCWQTYPSKEEKNCTGFIHNDEKDTIHCIAKLVGNCTRGKKQKYWRVEEKKIKTNGQKQEGVLDEVIYVMKGHLKPELLRGNDNDIEIIEKMELSELLI